MHPFYGPSARLLGWRARESTASGLVSMAAYLAFWAAALVLARRELDARFPRAGHAASPGPATPPADAALSILRERFARGEIDEAQFRAMAAVLAHT